MTLFNLVDKDFFTSHFWLKRESRKPRADLSVPKLSQELQVKVYGK